MPALLARLNGTKHLLVGNNNPAGTIASEDWASVHDYAEVTLDGRALVLCHYPFRSWNGQGRGAINLHGQPRMAEADAAPVRCRRRRARL